jgi:hypothetical protein
MVSKLWEIRSGLFILNPDPYFLPIPLPGSRVQKGTGSGSGSWFPKWCESTICSLIFAGVKDLVNAADAKRKRHEKFYE